MIKNRLRKDIIRMTIKINIWLTIKTNKNSIIVFKTKINTLLNIIQPNFPIKIIIYIKKIHILSNFMSIINKINKTILTRIKKIFIWKTLIEKLEIKLDSSTIRQVHLKKGCLQPLILLIWQI